MTVLQKNDKKIINGWVMYDWANSVYPLVITSTVFPVYYENLTHQNGSDIVEIFGLKLVNTALYSYVISLSFLIVSILSPILSGIADYSGNKKRFMQFFTYLGSFSCMMLYFFDTDHLALGLLFVLFASIGFSGSIVFYNAYLPEIATPDLHDKISAKGFSMGYIGGAILLIFNLMMIQHSEWFGIEDNSLPAKISFITVGLWWAGFAQITFKRLPNNVFGRKPDKEVILKGFREIKKVLFELKDNRVLKTYLLSFFIFSMAVQTVMYMAVMFGKKEIAMDGSELIITILIIQFVAIFGAFLFSRLSGLIGNIKALGVSIIIWIGICIGAYFVYTPNQFFVVAAAVGLVMGGIQSLARSTYSKLLPQTIDHASYFSFYDICEKMGIVIGTFIYGYIEQLTGSMRNSVFALALFFVVGLIILFFVPSVKKYRKEMGLQD
ncbi:MAG TPA: MFS transporter [Flavobacteriales bacterium]|nr:MFS transporter [Flavobacteriales bacterium]|tara:strand:- start:7209 stop:8522 length:1314 start_codon:yes stop_codon:yes gene_type:complete